MSEQEGNDDKPRLLFELVLPWVTEAAARGDSVEAAGAAGLPSDVRHVRQSHEVSCGPACGEMASGHHARTMPGSVAATEARLMQQPEFSAAEGGRHGDELAAAPEREAPVAGRAWKVTGPLPKGPLTHQQVRAGLEAALQQGNGVAILKTYKLRPDGGMYPHWVVVRGPQGGKAMIHDPESRKMVLKMITAEGLGRYNSSGRSTPAARRSRRSRSARCAAV